MRSEPVLAEAEAFALVRATDVFSQPAAVNVTRESGMLVHETRSYGGYWHGNVFDLRAAPADDAELSHILDRYATRFAWRTSNSPAVVKWCAPLDAQPHRSRFPIEETIALAALVPPRGREPEPAIEEIRADDDDAWRGIARCSDDDPPEYGAYRTWAAENHRIAVASGAARWFAVRDAGRIVSNAGLFRGGYAVRYADVATAAAARGRGRATRLIAGILARANDDAGGVRIAVILALHHSQAERIYRRAGFTPIALRRAAVVPAAELATLR